MLNPYKPPNNGTHPRKEGHCSFCGGDHHQAGSLVERPELAFICRTCCAQVLKEFAESTATRGESGQCDFCTRDSNLVGRLLAANNGVVICHDCALTTQSLLEQGLERRTCKSRRR